MSGPTDPWLPKADTALREPLEQVWAVTFTHPSTSEPIVLEVENGNLTYDEAWSPHVQADLQCRVPDAQDVLDLLDPRTGAKVQVYAGYRYFDGTTDMHLVADLWLFSRVVNRPANLMDLTAHSDEIKVQDSVSLTTSQPPKTGAGEAITWLIEHAMDPISPGAITSDIGAEYMPDMLTELEVAEGDSYASAVSTVADSTDLWVYHTGLTDGWVITPRPRNAGSAVCQLTTGRVGNITESEASLSREDWYNTVLLRHTWKNASGDDVVRQGAARITSGPMDEDVVGRRVLVVERETPISTAAVKRGAAAIVRRTVTRGREFNIQTPSAYWVRPGKTVTVRLPTGPQERHLVAAVSFRFPSGDMSVRTRVPENVTITTGE